MESDQEELCNEDEVKAIREIRQPIAVHEEEDEESMDESDELSLLGEDLVNRSLAEVTALLDSQMDLNSSTSTKMTSEAATATEKKSTKRISFLVPTNVPRISISSAGSDRSADESWI